MALPHSASGYRRFHDNPRARLDLERDVQDRVGPIKNIAHLSDAELMGMRDRARIRAPFSRYRPPNTKSPRA